MQRLPTELLSSQLPREVVELPSRLPSNLWMGPLLTSLHTQASRHLPGLVVLRGHSWVWANCSRNILVPWIIAGQRSKPHPCIGSHRTIKWINNLLKSQQQSITHTLVHKAFVRHDNRQEVSQRARANGNDKLNNILQTRKQSSYKQRGQTYMSIESDTCSNQLSYTGHLLTS